MSGTCALRHWRVRIKGRPWWAPEPSGCCHGNKNSLIHPAQVHNCANYTVETERHSCHFPWSFPLLKAVVVMLYKTNLRFFLGVLEYFVSEAASVSFSSLLLISSSVCRVGVEPHSVIVHTPEGWVGETGRWADSNTEGDAVSAVFLLPCSASGAVGGGGAEGVV